MRFKTTFWLLILAALLAGGVRLSWHVDAIRTREQPVAERFLGIKAESVESLTVRTPEYRVVCVRERGGWRIREPLSTWADKAAVDRILSALESLSGNEVVTHEQRRARALSLNDYGLLDAPIRIGVSDRLRTRVLFVGDEAPLGDLRYVRVVGAPDVIGVARDFVSALPARLDDFRNRALLHGHIGEAFRVDVQSPASGFIQLTAASGEWRIQQPMSTRADRMIVERMLDGLFSMRIERFVWDAPPGGPAADVTLETSAAAQDARFEPYGLASDVAVRVSVWLAGIEPRQEVWFGKEHGESNQWVYARVRDSDSVYDVNAEAVRALPRTLDALRAREVFLLPAARVAHVSIHKGDRQVVLHRPRDGGWSIADPIRAAADRAVVDDLVERLCRWRIVSFDVQTPSDPVAYGLAPPQRRILLAEGAPTVTDGGVPPPPGWPAPLLLGRPAGENAVYGSFDPSREVFLLPAQILEDPRLDPNNALLFSDRTMLAIPRNKIVRVSLEQAGVERNLAIDESGVWRAVTREGSPRRRVLADVLEDLLLFAANLRVLRTEALAPPNVAVYGLDTPRATVTFVLTGEGGIRKSLLVGGPAGSEGYFAMVRGQDVVFVLGREDAGLILRDPTVLEPSS